MMKKLLVQLIGGILFILLIFALITFATFARPKPGFLSDGPGTAVPQNTTVDFASALRTRLSERGVPVKELRVEKNEPLEVEVILQSSSDSTQPTTDDRWHLFLVEHEVELSYLSLGARVASFRYIVLNAQGIEIYRTYGNIMPDAPSQKVSPARPTVIADQEIKALLMRELDLLGMELISMDVQTGHFARENTQFLQIELSASALPVEKIPERVSGFLAASQERIEGFNSRYGSQITLLRVTINGPQRKQLAHYMLDLDRRSQSFRLADGIEADWLPRPAPEKTELPQPTPEPSETPPTPTAGPTVAPYP